MDSKTLNALAEPNRFKIIELLRKQPRSVNEVALTLNIRQPQASKHLQTLTQAGLVSVHPYAQQRIYLLNEEPFLRIEEWFHLFNAFWNQRLDNLDQYLKKG